MKIRWKPALKKRLYCAAVLFAGIFFFSCESKIEVENIHTTLGTVDSYIESGRIKDAASLLKSASKTAYSLNARLGVFQRYDMIGDEKSAEKILKKCEKYFPDSAEVRAVYAHFLLERGRNEEALKKSENLRGTKYGSIYSECFFKNKSEFDFYSAEYSGLYLDCYNATQNEKWLLDAAVPYLLTGNYESAAVMQKKIDGKNADFWAKVQFDAGNYDLCLENIGKSQNSASGENALLASDAYFMLDDFDSAEKVREKIISLTALENDFFIPDLIIVNSAIWNYNASRYAAAYELLTDLVLKNGGNVPALLTYAKFARLDSQKKEEDFFETELRKTPLRSISMQENDERPRFLIKDAEYRINQGIKIQKSGQKAVSPELVVEKLSLFLHEGKDLPPAKIESKIWETLEENEIGGNLYPPLLVNFCTVQLLNMGKYGEARNLFSNFIDARYKLEKDGETPPQKKYDSFGGEKIVETPVVPKSVLAAAFGNRAAEYADKMEIWEVEMSAYFSLLDGNIPAAQRLYEYALFETGGMEQISSDDMAMGISSFANVSSAVNLADIYFSQGKLKQALALYGIAAGKTKDKKLKSEILFRIAGVQTDLQNKKSAILSLDYALSLDPMNAKANLLRKRLKAK